MGLVTKDTNACFVRIFLKAHTPLSEPTASMLSPSTAWPAILQSQTRSSKITPNLSKQLNYVDGWSRPILSSCKKVFKMHVVRIPGECHFKIYIPIKISFQETIIQGPFPHHPFVRRCETILEPRCCRGQQQSVITILSLQTTAYRKLILQIISPYSVYGGGPPTKRLQA